MFALFVFSNLNDLILGTVLSMETFKFLFEPFSDLIGVTIYYTPLGIFPEFRVGLAC